PHRALHSFPTRRSSDLPAHEHRFVGLPGRLAELKEHHEHRFAEVVEAVKAGRDTAWAVAGCMKWSRSWDRIEGFMRRAAVAEEIDRKSTRLNSSHVAIS